MIDNPTRKTLRFPAEKEHAVAEALEKQLSLEKEKIRDNIVGIASGASGGDILFHEICKKLKISTEMYLALPREDFKKKSVTFAGKSWEKRFENLTDLIPTHILPQKSDAGQNVWEQTNLWMFEQGIKHGSENITLIALWDMKEGDGDGGTEHMVNYANEQGIKTVIININCIK